VNLRHLLFLLIPLLLAVGAGVGVYFAWGALQPDKSDPRGMPTKLYGRRVPGFRLPGLVGAGINSLDLINGGKPALLVFWSSWSAPCMQQHPVLLLLKDEGVHIYGIAYRDKRDAAADFLERNTNPFDNVALDEPGRMALDFGIQMVPETYLLDGDGFVRWHMVGPMTPEMVTRQIAPLLRKFAT
jgi:cytochrome c biogenesis protein CcmG/thiol:disulfide interchange protein DsbE